jgi:hypothetical protein
MSERQLGRAPVLGVARGVSGDVYLVANLSTVARAALAVEVDPSTVQLVWEAQPGAAGELLCRLQTGPLTTDWFLDLCFQVAQHGRALGLIARARTLTLCHAERWGVDADPVLDLTLPLTTAAEISAQMDRVLAFARAGGLPSGTE